MIGKWIYRCMSRWTNCTLKVKRKMAAVSGDKDDLP